MNTQSAERGVSIIHQILRWPCPIAFIATSAVLFAPTWLRVSLGLDGLLQTHRSWIGGIWLVSFSYVLLVMLSLSWNVIRNCVDVITRGSRFNKLLNTLTPDEFQMIRYMALGGESFIEADLFDPVMNTLLNRGLVFRTTDSSFGNLHDGFPVHYSLQPWVRTLAQRKPDVFALSDAA